MKIQVKVLNLVAELFFECNRAVHGVSFRLSASNNMQLNLPNVHLKSTITINMTIVSSTVLRNNLADSLKQVDKKKDYLLVSKKGKITSALVNIDLFEDLMALSKKDYVKSIRKARREYEKGDILTHEEVFGEI